MKSVSHSIQRFVALSVSSDASLLFRLYLFACELSWSDGRAFGRFAFDWQMSRLGAHRRVRALCCFAPRTFLGGLYAGLTLQAIL